MVKVAAAAADMDGMRCGCDAVRDWRRSIIARRPEKTSKTWTYWVTRVHTDVDDCELFSYSRQRLNRILESLTPHAAASARSALVDFYDFVIAQGLREDNPAREVRIRAATAKRVARGWTPEQLAEVVAILRPDWPRIADAVQLQAMTGMRPGELLRLATADVHLDERYIDVFATKTGKVRVVPLNRAALEAATRLCEGRVGGLFAIGTTRYWQLVRTASAAAGIQPERRRPYALRHTFATRLNRAHVPDRIIAELLGHADLRYIWPYTAPDNPELRDAVAAIDLS